MQKENICKNCGFENPHSANYCNICGAPLKDHNLKEELRNITIVFIDISEFTRLSLKYDPEELKDITENAISIITGEIEKYGGKIDKYLGDGVLALFGIPTYHEDDTERAIKATLSINDIFSKKSNNYEELNVRTGIHIGEVITGQIGSSHHREHTVLGSAVNIAKRIQESSSPGDIFVSEAVYKKTSRLFNFLPVGDKNLKGIKEPLSLFKVEGIAKPTQDLIEDIQPILIGREQELEQIQKLIERVKNNQDFHLIGVIGDAGIGKTRFIKETLRKIPGNNFNLLNTLCSSYNKNTIYKPFQDILWRIFQLSAEMTNSMKREYILKTLSEAMKGEHIGIETASTLIFNLLSIPHNREKKKKDNPDDLRNTLYKVIERILIHFAKKNPTVIVIDNFHWTDDSTLNLLEYLTRTLNKHPVLIIAISRPEIEESELWKDLRDSLNKDGNFTSIHLNELSFNESIKKVKNLLGADDFPEDLFKRIYDTTGGNPLFIEEYIKLLVEKSLLYSEGGVWELQEIDRAPIPDNIAGIMRWRIDRLQADERETIQYASIIGIKFWKLLLEELLNKKVDKILDKLVKRGMVESIGSSILDGDVEYSFKHDFLRMVAYNSILKRRRVEIHKKIVQNLESKYKSKEPRYYPIFARHYEGAEIQDKAFQFYRLSAENAYENFATSEAIKYYRKVEDISSNFECPDYERADLLQDIGMCLRKSGDYEESLEYFSKAINISPDDEQKAQLYSLKTKNYNFLGKIEDALENADKGISLIEEKTVSLSLLNLYYEKCWAILRLTNDLERSKNICNRALEILENIEDKDGGEFLKFKARILNILGIINYREKDFDEAIDLYEQSLKIYRDLDIIEGQRAGLHNIGLIKLDIGDYKKAEGLFKLNLEMSQKIGDENSIAMANLGLAYLYTRLNNLKKAESHATKATEKYKNSSNLYSLLISYILFSEIAYFQKDNDKTLKYAEKAFNISKSLDDKEKMGEGIYYFAKTNCRFNNINLSRKLYNDYKKHLKDKIKIPFDDYRELFLESFIELKELENNSNKKSIKKINSVEKKLLKARDLINEQRYIEDIFEVNYHLLNLYLLISNKNKSRETLSILNEIIYKETKDLKDKEKEQFLKRHDRAFVIQKTKELSIS
jgi:predicted ATPase/class 3 adenylate cyclase